MKEKKITPLAIVHIFLMLNAAVMSILGALKFISGASEEAIVNGDLTVKLGVYMFSSVYFIHVLALLSCILYTIKGYSKSAAVYYKELMLLLLIATVLGTIGNVMYKGFALLTIIMMAVKVAALLIMMVGKDLGKTVTFVLFFIAVAMDIVSFFMMAGPNEVMAYMIGSVITRILIDLTLGLAVKGKYDDKSARGTK